MAEIACILINYRLPQDTLACLRSLQKAGSDPYKVFLINNFTADGSGGVLQPFLRDSGLDYAYFDPGANLGYTGGMNFGIAAALQEGIPTVLCLNNDTVVKADFTREAQAAIRAHPGAVLAGCVLDHETGKASYNIGRISPWTGRVIEIFDAAYAKEIDFVSGCMMFIPAAVLRSVGLFDDRLFMYREDFDFCMRLKRHGVPVRYCPRIVVSHKVSSSTKVSKLPMEYYRTRNQSFIILHQARPLQKILFLGILACTPLYKLIRRPRQFLQVMAAIRDALAGRMGKRHADLPAGPSAAAGKVIGP